MAYPGASENFTMFQGFEWDVPADNNHWKRLYAILPDLKRIGIDNVWIPPACKGSYFRGNGYDIYDLYDLGEFEQKGSRGTKWGSKEDLLDLANEAWRLEVGLYFDAVLNHRCGGDATERVEAVLVDPKDRMQNISKPGIIEPWLKFNFHGRGNKYSNFRYNWQQFNATDYDNATGKKGILKITSGGKRWAEDVDNTENGSGDYLLLNNLDYTNVPLREEVKKWGQWVTKELALSGFRLDAAHHMSQGFANEWMATINSTFRKRLFYVGEFWSGDVKKLVNWLSRSPSDYYLFDVPLFYNLTKMSWAKEPDLRRIFEKTLAKTKPENALTFVMNHDTQKGQAMDQDIKANFIPHAYTLILLRQEGYPCVFYGDLYGICPPHPSPPTCWGKLTDLVLARKLYAYGQQVDYFDRPDCIGWVRLGARHGPRRFGMAVIMSWVVEKPLPRPSSSQDMRMFMGTADPMAHKIDHRTHQDSGHFLQVTANTSPGVNQKYQAAYESSHHDSTRSNLFDEVRHRAHRSHQQRPSSTSRLPLLAPTEPQREPYFPHKRMYVGSDHAGEVWTDLLQWEWAEVKIDQYGYGIFPCQKNSLAIFVSTDAPDRERFPVPFNYDIYKRDV